MTTTMYSYYLNIYCDGCGKDLDLRIQACNRRYYESIRFVCRECSAKNKGHHECRGSDPYPKGILKNVRKDRGNINGTKKEGI